MRVRVYVCVCICAVEMKYLIVSSMCSQSMGKQKAEEAMTLLLKTVPEWCDELLFKTAPYIRVKPSSLSLNDVTKLIEQRKIENFK